MEKRWNLNYMPHEFNEVKEYIEQMQDFPVPWINALAFSATLYSELRRIEVALAAAKERIAKYQHNIDTTEAATGMSGIYAKLEGRIKVLEDALTLLHDEKVELQVDELKANERIKVLEANLAVADKGLLKASDPKSGWAGISKECKLWQERAEQAEERIKVLEENLRILLSVKITDSDGNISLATNEERYQIARKALEVKP